ncbi:MAG: 3-mercaptopyruvate sulfurtransferase [Pseudomonadota bacterium]
MSPLISVEELQARQDGVKVLDASWHLDGRDARAAFGQGHVPGAVFFDLDAASDQTSALPHMLPPPEAFAAFVGALGIRETDHVVVYDTAGLFSAARVWWMFRVMGAERVQVLDGGLPAWRAAGGEIETGAGVAPASTRFTPRFTSDAVAAIEDVRTALAASDQVVDARGGARFRGEAAEPRPGVRPGHMPGALNLPYSALLTPEGRLKRGATLEAAFRDAGVDIHRPVTTTCGSGVTAAILSLGLAELGRGSRLYDGSWAEWGSRTDTSIQTG